MSKVRVYKVTSRNVHGEVWEYIVPAHSTEAALQEFGNPDLKYVADHIGFHVVELYYNGSEMYFQVCGCNIESGYPGYEHLCSYFRRDIDAFTKHLRDIGRL